MLFALFAILAYIIGTLFGAYWMYKAVGWRVSRLEDLVYEKQVALTEKKAVEKAAIANAVAEEAARGERRVLDATSQIRNLQNQLEGKPSPKCGCDHAKSFHINHGTSRCNWESGQSDCSCQFYAP